MSKCITNAATLIPKITQQLLTQKDIDLPGLYSFSINELVSSSTGIEDDLKEISVGTFNNELGMELSSLPMHIANIATNMQKRGIKTNIKLSNNREDLLGIMQATAVQLIKPTTVENITSTEEQPAPTVEGEENQTSDSDVIPEDKTEDVEEFQDAPIAKPINARKLRDVLKHYLVGNMIGMDESLAEFFNSIVARSWLSTDIAAKTGFEFDEKVVKNAIRGHLNKIIRGYYQKNATLIHTVSNVKASSGISIQENNTLIYDDYKKLPPDKKLLFVDEEDGSEFYTSKSIVGSDGNPLLLVIADDPDTVADNVEARKELFGDNAYVDDTKIIAAANNGMPALNRDTVQKYHLSTDVTSAYFATIVKDNLNTFIRDLVPQLEKSFKTFVRTGPMAVDVAGSDMASKLLKLSIASTPVLYTTEDINKSIKLRKKAQLDAKASGITIGESLMNSSLLESVDIYDNKAFSYKVRGNTYYGLVFNAGGNKVTLVYDPLVQEGNRWSYALSDEEGRIRLMSSSEFAKLENIDGNYKSYVNNTLNMLNTMAGGDSSISNIITQVPVGVLSELDAQEMISTLNVPPKAGVEQHVLTSNNLKKKFLYETEVEMASEVLQFIPDSFADAKSYLQDIMTDDTNPHRNVARSLYYRYFHEGEYKVTQINPTTGLVETVTHRSMYDQAMRDGNVQAKEAVLSLFVKLKSTALSNKLGLIDGRTVVTNVQQGTTIDSMLNDIDVGKTILMGNRRITDPDVFKKFKVRHLSSKGGKARFAIDFFKLGKGPDRLPDITITIEDVGYTVNGAIKGQRYRLIDEEFNNETAKILGQEVGLPPVLYSQAFYQQLSEEIVDGTIGDFFVNAIVTKLANGGNTVNNRAFAESEASKLKLKQASTDSNTKYTFKDNANKFRDPLNNTLEKIFSNSKRRKLTNAEGSAVATTIVSNKATNLKQLIEGTAELINSVNPDQFEKIAHVNKRNRFTRRSLILEDNGLAKIGIKDGKDGISNRGLSKLDQMVFQLESSYLDIAEQSKFQSAAFQAGTMSDRSTVPQYVVALDEEVMPVKDGKLDVDLLRSTYEESLRNGAVSVSETVTEKWKGYIAQLIANGEVTLEQLGVGSIDDIRDISTLYTLLDRLKLDFNKVKADSGLPMHMMIAPHTDKDGKKYVNLNYGMVQYFEIMTKEDAVNRRIRNFLITSYQKIFRNYIDSVGYEISDKAIRQISNRLGHGAILSAKEATDILLTSYFYQDGMVEQELISFLGGTLFQYARKEMSFFEQMADTIVDTNEEGILNSTELIAKSPETILDFFSNIDVEGKPLSETSFDELEALGPAGNRLGLIKAILDSDMLPGQKAVTLLFDDLSSGMSPQYIDRVKRNQGIGTSHQSYILAEDHEAGMYVPKNSKVILFEDPEKDSRLLNSGNMSQEIYDAMQQTSPIFLYQHNYSLGNRFSNFRAKGILKTVNVGNDENGIYNYEKKAEFPMFSYEMSMHASPIHQRMFEMHHDSVRFNEEDPEYEGLFVDEDPLQPSEDFDTEITVDQLKKHGEYLGDILVDGKKENAASLLYRAKLGEVDLNALGPLMTNKTLVKVGSVLELYRFLGGEELEAKMIREADNQDAFIDEFPFGYVWYKVTDIISNYRGAKNNFPLRNAYIAKSHTAQTNKTGQKNVNSASLMLDPKAKFSDIKTHETSNKYGGPVLMLDLHKGDTTASMNIASEEHDDLLSMITQIISSAVAEGQSLPQTVQLLGTLGQISKVQLDIVQNILDAYVTRETKRMADEGMAASRIKKLAEPAGMKAFAKDLAEKTLATRKDPGATGEIIQLGDIDPNNLSFDIRQVLPLVRSALTSDMSKRTVRLKVKGAQYALASATEKIKTYTIPGHAPLMRNSVNGTGNDVNGALKAIIATDPESLPEEWALEEVTDLADLETLHNKHDYVYIKQQAVDGEGNTSYTYIPIQVKDAIRQVVNSENDIIFVHPAMNDTNESSKVINFDTEYNDITKWEEAKARAAAENKILTTSNPELLNTNSADFDKAYTLSSDEYLKRELAKDKDAKTEDLLKHKRAIDVSILRNIDQSKVVTTNNYLSTVLTMGSSLVSPWLNNSASEAKQKTVDGDDLKYMDYYKDGVSIFDTHEYHSYFLAGKAPKDFQDIRSKATENAVKPVYTAVFVNPEETLKTFEPVHPNTFGGHVTVAFRPKTINVDVGKNKAVKVIGRLTTDKVDVLIVDNVDSSNEVAHITLAVADGVKPFESNSEIKKYADQIQFYAKPITLKGKYGYFAGEGGIITDKRAHNKLVKANYGASLVNTVSEYFTNETGRPTPPAMLLARFIYRNDENLTNTPILGPNLLERAEAEWTNDPAQVEEFIDYILEEGKDPQLFTAKMKPQLINQLQQPGWTTKESEFYMPPHHQAGYLMYNGDLLEDYYGIQEQPDLNSIAPLVTEQELELIHTKWFEEKDAVEKILQEKLIGTEAGDKYIRLRKAQNANLGAKFEERIGDIENIAINDNLTAQQREGLKKRAPILLLHTTKNSKTATLKLIDELLADKSIIGNPDAINMLIKLKVNLSKTNKVKDAVEATINDYKRVWKMAMMDSFDKSLTFLTARIPAHGKPSATAGKIKNFIYSSRNAIYGPIELLTIAGSDFDGDKQNNMTWDIDNLGRILDWKAYIDEDTGEVNLTKFQDSLDSEVAEMVANLTASGVETAVANAQGAEYKKAKLETAYRAMENLVTDLLIKIAKDPKNAIETTTATSMRKLGIIKNYLDSFNFSDTDLASFGINKNGEMNDTLLQAILKRQYALPFVPSTKFLYEKVNGEGKTGVGIFASAIKAYYATYFAWLTNGSVKNFDTVIARKVRDGQIDLLNDDIDTMFREAQNEMSPEQKKEEKYIKFKNKHFNDAKYKKLGVAEDALHFIWRDPETGLFKIKTDIFTIANSKQFMPTVGQVKAKLHSDVAKKVFSDMVVYRHSNDAEKEAQILIDHMESLDSYNNMIMEDQAWEDLAELLNAATDNAKELILSKIGANSHTSSLIATMVMLGIDLKSALLVLNDPIAKEVLQKLEKYGSLTQGKPDVVLGLKALLKDAATRYGSGTRAVSNAELEASVLADVERRRAAGETISEDAVKREIQHQKDLRTAYNPGEQLAWYVDMAAEITKLSGNLSINQGLPNSEIDVLNYILGLESSFGLRGAEKLSTKFNMNDFIADKTNAREEVMDKYNDRLKVAFNVPYIMAKNDHMFMYISSLYKTNEILKKISYTVRLIYDDLTELLPELKNRLEPQEMKSYIDMIMAISVDQFYKETNKKITLNDVTYDLSNYEDRARYVKDFPDILKDRMANDPKLSENVVLGKISNIRSETDPVTGITYNFLSGIDTSVLESGEVQIYKNKLANLKETHPDLHDALFHYSLNVDKAGLGRNAIAVLFEGEDYLEFSKFLNKMENSGLVEERIGNIPLPIKHLLLPFLMPQYSTAKGAKNDILRKIYSGQEEEVSEDEMSEFLAQEELEHDEQPPEVTEQDEVDTGSDSSNAFKNSLSEKYDVANMNKLKMDNYEEYPPVFVSKTNNLIYAWYEPKNTYIPITKTEVSAVMNSDITSTADVISDMKKFGYDWGFEAILPDTGEKGRILYLKDEFDKTYYVLRSDGKTIDYFTEETLHSVNPQIYFAKKAIIVRKAKYRVREKLEFYRNKKTGAVHQTAKNNTELIAIETTDDKIINEYDKVTNITQDAIDRAFRGKAMADVGYGKVMSLYPSLITELQLVAFMTDNKGDVDPKSILSTITAIENEDSKLIDQKVLGLKRTLEELPLAVKYKLLRATKEKRIEILKGLTETNGLFEDTVLSRDYSRNLETNTPINRFTRDYNGKTLVKGDYEILTTKSTLSEMTVRDFLDIVDNINISPRDYLRLSNKDVLVYKDNVYLAESVKTKTIEAKERKAELLVPTNKKRKFIKQVSPEVITKLGVFLNNRFKNTKVRTLSTADIRELYGEKFANNAAFVYAGTIVLNTDVADLETMLHEMGHLYLAELKEKNLDEYNRLMDLAMQDPMMEEMRRLYPELTETDIAEEAFVELLARRNSDKMESQLTDELEGDDGTFLGKVKSFFKNLFGSFFGISTDRIKDDFRLSDSLYDVIDKVGTDMIFNKNSTLRSMTTENKTIIRNKLDPNAKMSKSEALKLLTDRGYIRKVC